MTRKLILTLGFAGLIGLAAVSPPALASSSGAKHPPEQEWSHEGFTGRFDRGALQRGFQVYREVCSACHGLRFISFRNLRDLGFSEDEVKAIAADYEVEDGPDDEGEMFTREGRPSDHIPSPFPNEKAARASNNGAFPPDLSLIVKARPGGEDYIHALLTGFEEEQPDDFELAEGMTYNPYFANSQIAMMQPLYEDSVEYADGTPATVARMSHDVTTFLAWAAEPTLEARKSLGLKVMIYLVILAGLMYFVNKRVWRKIKG
ncbi:MAG: cytochrome c1 [Sphingomonadales bacterium]